MVLPDLIFDLVLFGVLLIAALVDNAVPALHGAALLFVVGAATYMAAQELCDALARRGWWTQESLATSIALSVGGFLYFGRNDSDLVLLCLSIGLMMASLMVAIAIIAASGAALKEGHVHPLGGLLLTAAGAAALGILAGLLTLDAPLGLKILVMGIGIIVWKLRESVRPPQHNAGRVAPPDEAPGADTRAKGTALPDAPARALAAHATGRWALIPQRGTLLDRFLPMLILGALLFFTMKRISPFLNWSATSPAAASSESKK